MPRGRFISKSIGHSREIAALPDDTARMVFAFMLPYLDVDGRIDADPVYLTGVCFSRLRMDPEAIARALVAMHEVGLLELYEELGLPYVQFINFQKHQHGLRADREPASLLPSPTGRFPKDFEQYLRTAPESSRIEAGDFPENSRPSLSLSSSEVEVEVEGEKKSASAIPEPGLSQRQQTTTAGGENRLQSLNLIKAKLGTRHSNRSESDPPVDLLTECFSEDPSRDKWLDIPPARVRTLIQKASQEKKKTRFGTFKGFLIDLLDTEAQTDMVKTTTTALPVAGGPPARRGLSEELLKESLGEELYAEMYGA